jgi:hypothetical protein
LLKGPKWSTEATIWVVYGGIGRGPFYPRIVIHLFPGGKDEPDGWSPYCLEIDFTGSLIRDGERGDAEKFLNGTLGSNDAKDVPRVWRYVVADHDVDREVTRAGITVTRVTERGVTALSVSNFAVEATSPSGH